MSGRKNDRQTGRLTGRQAGWQADKQDDMQTGKHTDRARVINLMNRLYKKNILRNNNNKNAGNGNVSWNEKAYATIDNLCTKNKLENKKTKNVFLPQRLDRLSLEPVIIFYHDTVCLFIHFFTFFAYPLSAKVVWAPQMTSQPFSSIFLRSPLPSGTWRAPDPSISWCFKTNL